MKLPLLIVSVTLFAAAGGAADPSPWGSPGSGPGQFASPTGIVCDHRDRVLVMDTNNKRIQRFTRDGGYLDEWGSAGSGPGQFNGAEFIAVDSADTVFVAD